MVGKLRPTIVGRGLAFAKGAIKGANILLRPLFVPFAKARIAHNYHTFTPLNIEPWLVMPIAAA
jgi:hypothetical protein